MNGAFRSQFARFSLSAAPVSVGLAVSSGQPLGIAAAVAMPALALRARSRWSSCQTAALYYGVALWPLIPGANNFFGPNTPVWLALCLWVLATALLSVPWLLVWSGDRIQGLWRAPVGIVLTIVPPLGIVGWGSPFLAAGILFPATAWCGLLACGGVAGALAVWPLRAAIATMMLSIVANLLPPANPRPPNGWIAIDTHFGSISYPAPSALTEFQAA
jgi:hypothetical protein